MYKNFSKIYDKFMENCDYDKWCELLEDIIVKEKDKTEKILDLGCGTGEILKRISRKYKCSGLDISKEMIEEAKKKTNEVKFFLGDMRVFNTLEKYDVVFSFFDTINHLKSLEELLDTFNSVSNCLGEKGIYIFDVVDRKFMKKMFKKNIFIEERDEFTLIWEHKIDKKKLLDVIKARYFIKNEKGTYEKYDENYEKKIFSETEIKEVIKYSDLKLEKILKNNYLAGERYFYILRKI